MPMIHVTVYRSNNQITAFTLMGHADSGPYGYDLVCAGVSAVSFGAVNAILELCEIDLEIEHENKSGYLHVRIPDGDHPRKKDIQLLFEGMLISLKTIEREYGQFIKISNQ